MTIKEVQDEIIRLKKEKDICILAHSYQAREIIEVADYTGDSYALSKIAAKAPNKTVIMCGVRFMAETCKILSPEKTVILSNPTAGCPMAEQMDREFILDLKKKHPGYTVVAYVNTTAALKTVCDVCVTSSSALEIVSKIESRDIIFVPDINLGTYVAENLPEKNVLLLQGGCPVHAAVAAEEAKEKLKAGKEFILEQFCVGARVKHKAWKFGVIEEISGGIIRIHFESLADKKNLVLPQAVTDGFLTSADPEIAERLKEYISVLKLEKRIERDYKEAFAGYEKYAEYLD